MRTWSSRCSMWNSTWLPRAAENSRTGMEMSPNVRYPDQTDAAIEPSPQTPGALHESSPCEVCQRGRTQQAQFLLWPRIKDFATAQTASTDSYQESLRVPRQSERYALGSVAAF